jgi:hypothetical protein
MASIHDSLLVGYTVDGLARTITLRTVPDRGMGGAFEVRFSKVVAYHFEGDCLQNILSGILEVQPKAVLSGNETARFKSYGWPSGWDEKRQSLPEFVAAQGARWYELNCAYGMGGWVAAAEMVVVPAEAPGAGQPEGV